MMDRVAPTLTLEETTGRTWDVLVIGAGPSGAVAASEVARQGARTLLVDRANFPRPKVCGCCLNGAAIRILDELGLGWVPRRCHAPQLREFQLAHRRRFARIPLTEGVALSRESFDAQLIHAAINAGADFLDGTRATVRDPARRSRLVALHQASFSVCLRARVVIIAGGLGCRAFAELDIAERQIQESSRIGAGAVVENASAPFAVGTIYMACHRNGYVGLVRLEDGRLDVAAALDGAAVKRHGGIGPLVNKVLEDSGWNLTAGLADAKWHGTAKLTQHRRRLFGDRFFVVGDAGGYVEPFTGEGIAWALATGRAVAPFVLASLESGTEETGPAWVTKHAALIGRRMRLCRAVSRLIRFPRLVHMAVPVLSRAPWLARPVVRVLNASFATP